MKKIAYFFVVLFFGIVWGQKVQTFTYAEKEGEILQLDVYTPDVTYSTSRPCMIWIHGGGFAVGSRDYKDDVALCKTLAQKGWVAVSISYRLKRKNTSTGFGCDCPKETKIEVFRQAISDYYDASLYVFNHFKEWNIDPNYVIAGGSSAGAETVLNAVYLKEFFLLDLSPYEKVKFSGVWSLAGAVLDADYITPTNAIPTAMAHGLKDDLVPYSNAPHHYCKPEQKGYLWLDGSSVIADKLRKLQTSYYFYSSNGGKHELASIPIDERLDEVLQFFDSTIKQNQILEITKIVE